MTNEPCIPKSRGYVRSRDCCLGCGGENLVFRASKRLKTSKHRH
jgi:hypothetical protein